MKNTLLLSLIVLFTFTACIHEIGSGIDKKEISINACEFFSDAEIEAHLGKGYTSESQSELIQNGESCKYLAKKDENRDKTELESIKNINFIVRETPSENYSKSEFDKAVTTWKNMELDNREFSFPKNFGKKAFFSYNEKTPQLVAYQGDKLIIVTFGNFYERSDLMLEKMKDFSRKLLQS